MGEYIRKHKVVVGDTQSIALDFPEAKAGETWQVCVQVENPKGDVLAHYITYKFREPVKSEGSAR